MNQKPKIPSEAKPSGPYDDERAYSESAALADKRDLGKEADEAQHERRENARNHIGKITVGFIWLGAALIGAAVLIYADHMMGPKSLRWLDSKDISNLQTGLSHIIIGGIAGFLVRNRFV